MDREHITRLSSSLADIISTNLAYSNHGSSTVTFEEATRNKNSNLEPIVDLLERLSKIDYSDLEHLIHPLISEINEQISKWKSLIDELKSPGINAQRDNAAHYESRINTRVSGITNEVPSLLNKLTPLVKICELDDKIKLIDRDALNHTLTSASKNLESNQEEFGKIQGQFTQWKTILEGLLAKESKREARSRFTELSASHYKWQNFWLAILGVAVVQLIWFVWTTWNDYVCGPANQSTVVWLIFRRAVWLGAGLLLFRTALTKFNTERHLTIVYEHRNAALKQLELMEGVLSDNVPAKAELRIAAAKMILSDPATGYAGTTSGSDFNFNPVIAAVERASTKSPQS